MSEEEYQWEYLWGETSMLDFLGEAVTPRKSRLFACARCRQVLSLLSDHARRALEVAERYADGGASRNELRSASRGVAPNRRPPADYAVRLAASAPPENWVRDASGSVEETVVQLRDPTTSVGDARYAGHNARRTLICDIFGNPFRPVAFDPAWRTEAVVGLARGIYEDRAFERMPILADALQDAGCEHPDILSHCREPGEHVRGCWVVDLLLGKS